MKTYKILDNRNYPFQVSINKLQYYDKVIIKKFEKEKYIDFLSYKAKQVFIGESHDYYNNRTYEEGKEFDGNTILIRVAFRKYIYIGHHIMSFTTVSPIVAYHSPVGNNMVPYPYAIDKNNNVYLMLENVILKDYNDRRDPYHYFYFSNVCGPLLTSDITLKTGIYYVNDTKKSVWKCDQERDLSDFDQKNQYIMIRGNKYQLTKQMYLDLLYFHRTFTNIDMLEITMIAERIYKFN